MSTTFIDTAKVERPETREFPTAVVLSIVTGRLVCEFDKVHEAIEWMAGEPTWTHQLPRVAREAAAVILERHPDLAAAVDDAGQVTTGDDEPMSDGWIALYRRQP